MTGIFVPARRLDRVVWFSMLIGLLAGSLSAENTPDTTPPIVVATGSADGSSVFLCFSERVDFDTAMDVFNYSVNGTAVSVMSASLSVNGLTVTLAVSGLSSVTNTLFTVTAENIHDTAGNTGGGTATGRVGDFFRCLPAPTPADIRVVSADAAGLVTWTNAFTNGVCSVETAENIRGPWQPGTNYFTSNAVGQARVPVGGPGSNVFCRLLAVEVSATPEGLANLYDSYGLLQTVAGAGVGRIDNFNYWQSSFEGGPATDAALSRPHFAIADRWDNIYVADKDSGAVEKITPDGTIHTVAGTHEPGFNGDGPAPATTLQLMTPTGEWLREDGTLYILDTGNGKVRRLDTNGTMTTLFTITNGIQTIVAGIAITNGILGGRGLWVKDDESLAYFTTDHVLWRWTPDSSFTAVNTNFVEMGNIWVMGTGQIIATDRGGSRVWRVETDGELTPFAGNGVAGPGLDGAPALECALYGVRGVWPVPNGGWLFATHEGAQVWHLDAAGLMHLFLDGARANRTHGGDGGWFHSFGLKISSARSVTLDHHGNVILMESDYGYVRKINFQRMMP